jgi:hypothetical protein
VLVEDERTEAMDVAATDQTPRRHPITNGEDRHGPAAYVVTSEAEADALARLGFTAIAVVEDDGVTEMVERLDEMGAKDVIVVASCPEGEASPSHDDRDVFPLYDDPYRAWKTAHMIEGELQDGPGCVRLATLPSSWHKEDIASVKAALASGVSLTQYLRVDSMLTGLTDEARHVLAMRMADSLLDEYEVTQHGVVRHRYRDTPARDRVTHTRVTHAPLWIVELASSAEGAEKHLTLAYTYPTEGTPRIETLTVERGVALNARRIVELAQRGLPVTSSNAGQVVQYLSELEAVIAPYLPTAILTKRNGWRDVNGQRQFVLGERNSAASAGGPVTPARLQTNGNGDLDEVVRAMRPNGSLAEWIELAQEVRDTSDVGRFMVATSFAAPLPRLLGMRSLMVHVYGETQSGKTAILHASAAVWADPRRYVVTHNATDCSTEYRAAFLCDLPVCLDELQLQRNTQLRQNLVYMFGNGIGRTRANRNGSLQDTLRWRGVCLSTGEEPITTDDDLGGQSSRVLELRIPSQVPLVDGDLADRLYRLDAWGHAGMMFVERLVTEDAAALPARYQELRRRLRVARPQLSGSEVSMLSVIALADALSAQWLFHVGREPEECDEDALRIVRRLYGDHDAPKTLAARALEWTVGWIDANHGRFVRLAEADQSTGTTYLGAIQLEDEVWLYPDAWARTMKAEGVSPRRVLADWRELGWIKTTRGKDGKPRHPSMTVPGRRRQRMIVLTPKAFAALLEE